MTKTLLIVLLLVAISAGAVLLVKRGDQEVSQPVCAFELGIVDIVGECISIRNASSSTQDLLGWSISDGEGSYTFTRSVPVNTGVAKMVCMDVYNPDIYAEGLYLDDESDEVRLHNPNGDECDFESW